MTLASAPTSRSAATARTTLRVVLLALLIALSVASVGCEKDAATFTNEGNVALVNKDYDKAVNSFQQALGKDPKSFDATVGLAQVYAQKNDFAKAKEYFTKAEGMGPNKVQLQYLNQHRQELFLAEAKTTTDKTNPQYETQLRGVIDANKRTPAADEAYRLLEELYMERGKALSGDPKTYEEAIVFFEKMRTIKTQPALRKDAIKRADELRTKIFEDMWAKAFGAAKTKLATEERVDAANKRIKFVATLEDKELKFKEDEEKEAARKKLLKENRDAIVVFTYALMGTPKDKIPSRVPKALLEPKTAKLDGETFEEGKATATVSITEDELKQIAFKGIFLPRRAAEREAKKDDAAKKDDGAKKDAAKADGAAKTDDAKKDAAKTDDAAAKDPKKDAPADAKAPAAKDDAAKKSDDGKKATP